MEILFVESNEEFSGQGDKVSRVKISLTFTSRRFSAFIAFMDNARKLSNWFLASPWHRNLNFKFKCHSKILLAF